MVPARADDSGNQVDCQEHQDAKGQQRFDGGDGRRLAEDQAMGRAGQGAEIPYPGGNGHSQAGQGPGRRKAGHCRADRLIVGERRRQIAVTGGDHHRHTAAEHQGWPKARVEESLPEIPALHPLAGGEHHADDAVDEEQRHPGGEGVQPCHPEVVTAAHFAEGIVVDEGSGDFHGEKHPFGGPGKDETVDQQRGCRRIDQGDDKPDSHSGDRSEDHGDEKEEAGVAPGEFKDTGVVLAQSLFFGGYQINAGADGKVGDEDVEDGDQGDEQAAAGVRQVPDRIVHNILSFCKGSAPFRSRGSGGGGGCHHGGVLREWAAPG